jgi:hypothetical protein
MNMLTLIAVIIIVSVIAGFCIAFEHLCRLGTANPDIAQAYAARHDHTRPRAMPADPFNWEETQALIDRENERLASTGELRALYERPYPDTPGHPRTAVSRTTGELRQLAEAGDIAALEADTAAYINSLEGEA